MELIFFDLDGTLLNASSKISPYTVETLQLLSEKDIAFTVATGRSMLSAQTIIKEHKFDLPHIYNNGVTIFNPKDNAITLKNLLEGDEISRIIECALHYNVAPFVHVIDSNGNEHSHLIYHGVTRHSIEQNLIKNYFVKTKASLEAIDKLPKNCKVTNISMIGDADVIYKMWTYLNSFESIIAYSGPAIEGQNYSWMDVHHKLANKGSAVENLKTSLGASKVISFGDSDNDLSMFQLSDECYAPSNAKDAIKEAADRIIGHHHEDGVAHFLRERFSL